MLLTNEISRKKCLLMKFERSLASVLLLRPNSSASFVRRELVSAVGSGAGTFFFFCYTEKENRSTIHVEKFVENNFGI